jgi:hypothetical protein
MSLLQIQSEPRKKITNKAWAILIQQVWEVDPLSCPNCGETMKLIAFISRNQQEIIQAILESRKGEIPDLEERTRGPPRWLAIQQARAGIQDHPEAYPEEDLDQSAHIQEEDYFLHPP